MSNFDSKVLSDFKVGQSYTNLELVTKFKCSTQGGMRRSYSTNTLVLITNRVDNNPYKDQWEGDILYYTGMGLKGDQSLDFAQNKTLRNSGDLDITLHLFTVKTPKEYTYEGVVEFTGEIRKGEQKGTDGRLRTIYQFGLRKKL